MKCSNCGREEHWEDASFCPRCGKQQIPILPNIPSIENFNDEKKIDLQIYQMGLWMFLTVAGFLYVSRVTEPSNFWTPYIVVIVSGIMGGGLVIFLSRKYLPKKNL
jgi:hypothetical protein